jgi:hypothetical protein
MSNIYQFTKIITKGADGTVIGFKQNTDAEKQPLELCTIDGVTYLSVPSDYSLTEQDSKIGFEKTVLTDELKEAIKSNSRACELISLEVQKKIREKYTLEDEQYFSRIGVGVALGAYTFLPGEKEALLGFGVHVEDCRQYGKSKRTELGL